MCNVCILLNLLTSIYQLQNWWWTGSDKLANEIESENAAQTTRKTIEIEAGPVLHSGAGDSCLCPAGPPGPRGKRGKPGEEGRVGVPGITVSFFCWFLLLFSYHEKLSLTYQETLLMCLYVLDVCLYIQEGINFMWAR